jgi:hypothetical protein
VATRPGPDKQDAYAVVRLDSFRNFTPRPENVTVRKVTHRLADAEFEVRHLNMTAPTGTVYFIQRTTVAPRNESIITASAAAVTTAELSLSARSRRVRPEKTGARKKR